MPKPENCFVQLDRCNAGVRLTIREGTYRRAPEFATLVRQPFMTDEVWDREMRTWLGRQPIYADTRVHAWAEHRDLGSVQDLLDGRIDQGANHG